MCPTGLLKSDIGIIHEELPLRSEPRYILLTVNGEKEQSELFLEALQRGNLAGLGIGIGGNTCHLASLSRDANIPFVARLKDVRRLHGKVITLNVKEETVKISAQPKKNGVTAGSPVHTLKEVIVDANYGHKYKVDIQISEARLISGAVVWRKMHTSSVVGGPGDDG